MLQQTSEDYSNIMNVGLDEKLKPINLCVDDMLTRLEEFEGLLALVQQERCTSIGLTGSLSQCADYKVKLKQYCTRIDSLEKLIEHIKNNISVLENKMDLAEKRVGIPESSSNLKTLLSPFRKAVESNANKNEEIEEKVMFSTDQYFDKMEQI